MKLEKFDYHLLPERIALHPLDKRDESRLIAYQAGDITHHKFWEISSLLPDHSLLFFNDTKVIPARIMATKTSGASIEILLLNPVAPSAIVSEVMTSKAECTWQCMIGNKKKWSSEILMLSLNLGSSRVMLSIELINSSKNHVRFSWDNPGFTFAEIVESTGQVPLPPYLNRQPIVDDKHRYQTVYSKYEGAVAAPTAGLHITENIIEELEASGHAIDYLTLHVGAGTFQPIKTEDIEDHDMHEEQIVISKHNIESILKCQNRIIPVGTTSMRSLESLYWYGVQLLRDKRSAFRISKELPYETRFKNMPSIQLALETVLFKMSEDSVDTISGGSSIYIYPGYQFQVCHGLITNFHQPKSSLILLVAALIGEDWKRVYQEALDQKYRFLSYGDSSLLLPTIDQSRSSSS